MSTTLPHDDKLPKLLLGQLTPAESEELSATFADDSRVVPVAESLADDTLLASIKDAGTQVESADEMTDRLVARLKPDMNAVTRTSDGNPDADAAEAMPPTLEYFKLERELGRGGMGTVYLAQDTRLGRPVAIKTLKADLARKPAAKGRFLREARVAAALEHECVVPIYYVGEDNGIPFLAMPVLKGRGLDDHLKANGGRLPVADVLRIATQVAGGLAAAHAVGLIHRDIKPSNLWVDADGRRVRVLDFGLARFEADDTQLTASGMIVGTPAYMAPEQARGRGVDTRADLFSLGVVMYQMLTGKRPFTGNDTVSILSSLALDTPPAPSVVNFDVPAELSDLVMRLLEKEPQNRPESAEVVRAALERLAVVPADDRTELDFSPPTRIATATPAPAARRKSPLVPLAVALGLFALLVGGAVAVYQMVFTNKDGTLVVEVDETADVRFKGGKLEVYDETGKRLYTLEPSEKNKALPPGKYQVKVVGADGVKLDTESFEIEKHGRVLVKVTASGPDVVAKKPDLVKPDQIVPLVNSDRKAAEWVITVGGQVRVNGEPKLIHAAAELPQGELKLTEVLLKSSKPFDEAALQIFRGCKHVVNLALDNTAVGKGGLEAFRDSQDLRVITLDNTKIDDDGLAALKLYPKLSGLRLAGTRVTDSGVSQLVAINLRTIKLNNTKITEQKIREYAKAVPGCIIEWDGGVIDPTSGTPLAMRQATWKVGPADNILPGLVARPAILDGVGRWQIVPTAAPTWGVSWSPDGKWVITHDDTVLRVYDATSGALSNLFLLNKGQPVGQATTVIGWSADSRWLKWGNNRGNSTVADGNTFAAVDGSLPVAKFETSSNADYGWNPKHNIAAWVPHSTFDRIEIIDPTQAKPIEIAVKVGRGKAVWSPDGETLLVVREDKTAQLFARDGTPGAKLAGEVDPAAPPAWSADAKQIAALASATEVGFWKADGTAGKKTGKHEKPVTALHWKPDGEQLAVSDAEGKRHFWKPDGTSEGVADTKDGTPGFAWAKDGKGFFTPGKFWPAVGNPSFTNLRLPGMGDIVSTNQTSVAQVKRGEILIAELKDGEVKDIGWKVLQTRDGTPWWSADGRRLAVSEQNGVTLYDARDPKKVVRLGGGAGVNGLNRAAFSPKGDRLAVANDIGHLLICEPTGKPLRTLGAPATVGATLADAIHDLQWHPDGKHLAVSTGAGTVTVFDTESGKAEATTSVPGLRAGGSAIFSPANPDHLLISHPDAAALWRWKVEKEPLQKFDGLGKLVPSPDGKRLLSFISGGGWAGRTFVQPALVSADLKDRTEIAGKEFMNQGNSPGADLAWHPDGKHLVVTRLGEARSIQIRTLDGKVVEEIKPDGIDVTWLEWVSPFATRNVLVGRSGQGPDTYLFDLTTKKLTAFGKVSGEITVSPDGKHLIAAEGSTMTYWNVDTKAVDQKVVLLPNGEFVTLSVAGEVLEKSANADAFYRYVVEDKAGKLLVKSTAEMAPSLPKVQPK